MTKITRKFFIGNILVLLALTACIPAWAEQNQGQEFSFAEEFRFTHTINGGKIYGHDFNQAIKEDLAREEVKCGDSTAGNHLELLQGNLLLIPDKSVTVTTADGQISLSGGSIVFIMQTNKGLVLYDLRQSLPKQVYISLEDNKFYIEPGNMVVITKTASPNFERLGLDCHSVIYRHAHQVVLHAVVAKVFVAEFSISAAFLTVKPLRNLIVSNNKEDKSSFEKILRSAANLDDFLGPIQPSQLANMSRQL